MCERKTYRRYVRKLRPTGGFANSSTDGWNCPSKLLNSEAQRTGFRIDQNPRKRYSQEYYISEVNPRFGGGYPHAYESGVNIPEQIITNLKKEENTLQLNEYEENIYMMKYNELRIEKLQKLGES